MSTIRATNFQHASAAAPAIVLAADGTAAATVSGINDGPLAGFRNAIINGNFDVWQRGTSFTATEYAADRWLTGNAGTTKTASRQSFTLGQTEVPGEPVYFMRHVVTSVAGASNSATLQQRFEGVRSFAGQQVTVSFWAKADAAKPIAVELFQRFGTGGSPSADVSGIGATKMTLGTAWQKFTVTAAVPSISGKTLGSNGDDFLAVFFWFDSGSNFNSRSNSLGQQSGTFDIAQVQVEAGPVATPFERRPIGTELALCQRYFWKSESLSGHGVRGFGYSASATLARMTIPTPVTLRGAPAIAGSPLLYPGGLSCSIDTIKVNGAVLELGITGSSIGGAWALVLSPATSPSFDAEL